MPKQVTFAVALLAVVLMSLSMSGCGGDEDRAKGYIEKGNETIVVIEKESKMLGRDMDSLFADLYKDISPGKPADTAAFDTGMKKLKALTDKILKNAGTARSQFEKVGTLKEIPDYKKYAALKIKIIDANVEGLKQLESFLDESRKRLDSKPFDVIAFQAFVTDFAGTLEKKGEETGNLQKQAEDLEKELNR